MKKNSFMSNPLNMFFKVTRSQYEFLNWLYFTLKSLGYSDGEIPFIPLLCDTYRVGIYDKKHD